MLSDYSIKQELATGLLKIEGVSEGAIGPASVDLMLSNHFVRFTDRGSIDPKRDNSNEGRPVVVLDGDFYSLGSQEFCLASTIERWTFPNDLGGRLEGKSSLGRLGLMVHTTAGFFDPGFEGYPTLELVNVRGRAIRLYPGMPIAQMSIFRMEMPSSVPYDQRGGSKYADQGVAPRQSMYHLNWVERNDQP